MKTYHLIDMQGYLENNVIKQQEEDYTVYMSLLS